MKRPLFTQRTDGEWVKVPKRTHAVQCCDCGLVHIYKFRVSRAGKISYAAWRHPRATAAARRRKV